MVFDAKAASPKKPARQNTKASAAKRIVIIDDHPLIRAGLERMIDGEDDLVVCGEAADASEAMTVTRRAKADLAIVDVNLPGLNGIDLTKQLLTEFPKLSVLVLSMHDESHYAVRAIKAGARGYMVKQDAVEKIGIAVRQVLQGELYLSPRIADEVLANVN